MLVFIFNTTDEAIESARTAIGRLLS